jgi:hypothetical protein
MTQKQFAEKLFKKYGIDYEECYNGFCGTRNGKDWMIQETCSWDGYYQFCTKDYLANRIKIQSIIKKILAM